MFGKGCANATFTVKTALQTLREQGIDSHALFIDLVEVYDSVNRELLWKLLSIFGVPTNLITVLKTLHTNVTYHMRIGEKKVDIKETV